MAVQVHHLRLGVCLVLVRVLFVSLIATIHHWPAHHSLHAPPSALLGQQGSCEGENDCCNSNDDYEEESCSRHLSFNSILVLCCLCGGDLPFHPARRCHSSLHSSGTEPARSQANPLERSRLVGVKVGYHGVSANNRDVDSQLLNRKSVRKHAARN